MLYFLAMNLRNYIITFVFMTSLFFAIDIPSSFGVETTDHDCMKCHKLTNEEALSALKDGIPDPKIIDIRPGPIKGVWEIAFEAQSRKNVGYLDFSKQKLVIGNVYDIKAKANLTAERMYEINRVDVSQIPLNDALVMGDKSAKYKVIVFDDPD